MENNKNGAINRRISGTIAYWGPNNRNVGREIFDLFFHKGGTTFRAFCEMGSIDLLRDVTMAFTHNWQPIDGFCRITQAGRVVANNWFLFESEKVSVESTLLDTGKIKQQFCNIKPFKYLGLHPLQGDALITTQVNKSSPGQYIRIKGITNSLSENGDNGLTAMPVDIDVAYLGNESLTVAAGRFNARKYALRWQPDWPPAYVWVKEEDAVFLKMTWEKIDNWYELTSLEGS
ncbi:MAG: hypothetical protein AB8B57_04640 [Congregibacter sp.]